MIDIIIPVYNAGKTLARTLNSVLEQVNSSDFCVYIVDDCSTDNYSYILRHFSKYLNITFLKTKKNGGPGPARNLALENSKNEYIVFLDSDDEFYRNDSVLTMLKAIDDYDMVFGQMYQVINGEDIYCHHEGCLHGKMYRRSFLEDKKIKFHSIRIKGGNAHEDNAFNQLYISCTNKVNYIDDVTYKYNDVESSITGSENRHKSFKCYIKSMDWLFKEIEKQKHIEKDYVGIVITCVMFYCYFNYLLEEKE